MASTKYVLLALAAALTLATAAPASAQVSVDFGFPGVHIGINMPTYPHLVRVPGYPVYYDSRGDSNYFFYDGLYWVYWDDNWYASSWYNGPWERVNPEYVPLYVLRVPVRYYRRPPSYFRGWRADAPPRWGDHWGATWESRRSGWDRWNRRSVPAPAPLPVYQQQYSGDRYPRTAEQERSIRTQYYRYQPREALSQQRLTAPPVTREARPAPQLRESRPAPRQVRERETRPAPQQVRERESRPAPRQVRERETRPAPQQVRERETRPAPQQVRERETRPAPQQVREDRPAPQAREQKAKPQGRGQGNKDKDERRGHERSDR